MIVNSGIIHQTLKSANLLGITSRNDNNLKTFIVGSMQTWDEFVTPSYTLGISGVVRDDNNQPCSRSVRAHSKSNPSLYFDTVSDPTTGQYSFNLPEDEFYLVFFDDDAGTQHNALILDKVTPA
jgi:hypothetical protein